MLDLSKIPFKQSPNCRLGGLIPKYIVIHTMQGTFNGTISWFMNPKAQVSAHYLINDVDGRILQMVSLRDKAWHVSRANPISVGIELSGYVEKPHTLTPIMWESCVELCASLCKKFGLSPANIIGHSDPIMRKYGNNHHDPWKQFDFVKFRKQVQAKLDEKTV